MRRNDDIRNRINEILNTDPNIEDASEDAVKDAAKDTFRLYKEYVNAGFTEDQALQLTLVVLQCTLAKGGLYGQ